MVSGRKLSEAAGPELSCALHGIQECLNPDMLPREEDVSLTLQFDVVAYVRNLLAEGLSLILRRPALSTILWISKLMEASSSWCVTLPSGKIVRRVQTAQSNSDAFL